MTDLYEQLDQINERLGSLERYSPSPVSPQAWTMHTSKDQVFYAPIVNNDPNDKSDYLLQHRFFGTQPTFDINSLGWKNSSLRFDYVGGLNDPWIYWDYVSAQDISGGITVALKVYPFTTPQAPEGWAMIFSKGGFESWNIIQEPGSGQISFSVFTAAGRQQFFSSVDRLILNQWNNVLCTRRADGLIRIYINGEFDQAMFDDGAIIAGVEPIQAGSSYNGYGFNGLLSDFYVINRFMSHQEAMAFAII